MTTKRSSQAAFEAVAITRVLYADTDRMGVVYHGTYTRFLELGRVEFMRGRGIVYAELERDGVALPVTQLEVRYLAPARYDERLRIDVRIEKVSPVRLRFGYRLHRLAEDDTALVTVLHATTEHASVRLEGGRVTRLPAAVYAVLASCYTTGVSDQESPHGS